MKDPFKIPKEKEKEKKERKENERKNEKRAASKKRSHFLSALPFASICTILRSSQHPFHLKKIIFLPALLPFVTFNPPAPRKGKGGGDVH